MESDWVIICNGNHSCPHCKPSEHPPHIRQSPDHVGLKFVDTTPKQDHFWYVWLNGVEITKQCYEALPGKNGFVRVYAFDESGKIHRCCYNHYCTKLVHGDVRTKRMMLPLKPSNVQVKAHSAVGPWIPVELLSTSNFGDVARELCKENKANSLYWALFIKYPNGKFEQAKPNQPIADRVSEDGHLTVWMTPAI